MAAARKPEWLKKKIFQSERSGAVHRLIREQALHTVCQGARCPNISECFDRGTATFMILGDVCTRSCLFCAVSTLDARGKSKARPVLADEPIRVAEAVKTLKLKHAVVTSVTRDDLPDRGANHFADTIRAIRRLSPGTTVEILTPDFDGYPEALSVFETAPPDIFNHNLETVKRLYHIRPKASYERSLRLLESVKSRFPGVVTKSGLMVGLGETGEEVCQALKDLRERQCECVTLGQYLSPSEKHTPVVEFVTPERFASYEESAKALGFKEVFSGPFVRSSYKAGEMMAHPNKLG